MVCGRATDQLKPWRLAASKRMSSCGVVEILAGQARLIFGEGRIELLRRIAGERAEIVLQPRHQRDVAQLSARGGCVDGVAEHRPVDAAVLGLGVRAAPGGVEHVRCRRGLGYRPAAALGIAEITGDVLDAGKTVRRMPRDAGNAPVALADQALGQRPAADAGDPEDQCRVVSHANSPAVVPVRASAMPVRRGVNPAALRPSPPGADETPVPISHR
jgi:hypothetical protein